MINNERFHVYHLFCYILLVGIHFSNAEASLCEGSSETFECLSDNFYNIYKTDHAHFWKLIYTYEKESISCKSIEMTAKFISLASIGKGSAEFNEYISEHIEQLSIKKTQCLLDAIHMLKKDQQRDIVTFLAHPLFHNTNSIKHEITKFSSDNKYRQIIELYLEYYESMNTEQKNDN